MLEPFGCGMSPSPCSHKHLGAAIALSLLLCVCCSRCYTNFFTSALLTMSVLLLSTSFPLLLPKFRLFHEADSIEQPQVVEVIPPKDEPFQEKDAVEGGEDESEKIVVMGSSLASSTTGELVQQEDHSNNNPTSEDESSEVSISDDENLIELELPEGQYVEPKKPSEAYRQLPDFRGGFLPCFLPESVFRQRGFKELLSEINEEDNLIEIDIIRGSIKCPRLEIKV